MEVRKDKNEHFYKVVCLDLNANRRIEACREKSEKAYSSLKQNSDGANLAQLGDWYARQQNVNWALQCWKDAKALGGKPDPWLRVLMNLLDDDDAARDALREYLEVKDGTLEDLLWRGALKQEFD